MSIVVNDYKAIQVGWWASDDSRKSVLRIKAYLVCDVRVNFAVPAYLEYWVAIVPAERGNNISWTYHLTVG